MLELAGVNAGQPPQVYDWGGGAVTVCQIDQEPRLVPDRCFGPTTGRNWSDSYHSAAGWVPRAAGVTGYEVRDGDMEGWVYANGFGGQPPAVTFAQVCPPAAPATRVQPTRAAVSASAPSTAAPTPSASSSPEALLPSTSPQAPKLLPVTASQPPAPPGLRPPIGVLLIGAAILGLAGLGTWNFRMRRSR